MFAFHNYLTWNENVINDHQYNIILQYLSIYNYGYVIDKVNV